MGAYHHRSVRRKGLERHPIVRDVERVRRARGGGQRLARQQHVLGLAAQPLGIVAEEVAQAAGPHLPQPLRGGMPDHVGLHAPAPQSAVIAARLAEALRVKRWRRRRGDPQPRLLTAVIDDGGQRPAGECGRLSLEHDERMLTVILAAVAQRQRRGPEPLGTTCQSSDPLVQLGQVAPEHPEHQSGRHGLRTRSDPQLRVTSRIV